MRPIYQKPNELLATGLLLLGLACPALAQPLTFQPATNYSTGPGTSGGFGSNPNGLVVADVNADGRPDLLTANLNTSVAAVLLGNGDGTFQNAVTYSTGTNSNPRRIAVADVNGDGRPDVLTANQSTSAVGVLLGNGNGTFRTVTTYSVSPGSAPYDIAVADVNGDGKPDLLTANSNSTAGVLLGNGNGTFQTAVTYANGAGGTALGIAAADVNGDGKLDLLTANSGNNTAAVLLGNGDGTFRTATTYAVGAGSTPADIAAADVNGDGKPDLLTANFNTGTAGVLLGNGNGTFQAAATYSTGAGSRPFGIAAADINGDGKPDLLTASGSGTAGALLGNGDGTFQVATNYSAGPNSGSSDIAVADVNGDNKLDLLTANSSSNTLGVLLNTTVASPPTLTNLSPSSGPIGSLVTLTGTNLSNPMAVMFNGVAATTFTAVNATTVTAVVPAGASTGPVSVTTGAGTASGPTFTITYPDLVVSTTTSIPPGTYNSITVTSTGNGTLAGGVVVNTAVEVQTGGTLSTNCQPLTGTGSFTLAAGSTLNICDPAGIAASGNTGAVQVAGTRSFSTAASYGYNGTAAQVTGTGLPATVATLVVNNPAGPVRLTQPLALARELRLTRGVFDLSNQAVTLLSDATATAQVNQDGSLTTGTVTGGSVTVQRFVPANGNASLGYRHFASPVSGNTLADLAVPGGFQPVFNPAYNSSPASGTTVPFPTVFGFDPARVGTAPSSYAGFDQGWYSPATGSGPDPFTTGRGYTALLAANQTVDFVGLLNQVAASLPLPRAAGTTAPDDNKGWHLLGNPFASAFALATLDNTPGVDNAKYVFQSTGPYAGSYDTYLTGLSGQPLLALGQGFFARTSTPGTAPVLVFALAGRRVDFTASSTFHRPAADTRPLLELALTNAAGTLRDHTMLYADAAATAGFDPAQDAVKLPNSHGLNLAQTAAGQRLAINGLPAFTASTVVPLTLGVPTAGSYALQVNQMLNLPAGTAIVLVDAQRNTRTDLAALPAAGYAFSVTAAQATALLTARFSLSVTLAVPLGMVAGWAAAPLQVCPNPARTAATLSGAVPGAAVRVFDALGRLALTATADARGTATLEFPAQLATGMYLVRSGCQAKRLVVE